MPDSVGFLKGRNATVELRVTISPLGLLSIAAIVLAGAVVTGVAIREAKRPRGLRLHAKTADTLSRPAFRVDAVQHKT